MRYQFWHAADTLVHALWPHRDGAHLRPVPRWANWICDRYDAVIWEEFG